MLVTVEAVQKLGHGQQSEVLSLVEAATRVDKMGPLSEKVLLAARDSQCGTRPESSSSSGSESSHFLAYAGRHLAGYAHLDRDPTGEVATGEILVNPSYRRQGFGTALILAIQDALPPAENLQVWSHGDLDAARAFALRGGFSKVRELWQMRRSLRSNVAGLPPVTLPEGLRSRHFVVGQDEETWLRVNARAFVDHPEQGRMTRHDLDQRIAESWFDAEGFILIEDLRGPEPVLAASHWTKVVPGEPSGVDPLDPPTDGEVYVVGVDPAYQGLGLGRAVTVLGLTHLRDQGLTEATLYVEADNKAAVATYSHLGFTRFAADTMYRRPVHLQV